MLTITPRTREAIGYTGQEQEYLLIPPEVLVDGKLRQVAIIDANAFCDCAALQTVVVFDGISQIRNNAFARCYGLKQIILPESLVQISHSAFL